MKIKVISATVISVLFIATVVIKKITKTKKEVY